MILDDAEWSCRKSEGPHVSVFQCRPVEPEGEPTRQFGDRRKGSRQTHDQPIDVGGQSLLQHLPDGIGVCIPEIVSILTKRIQGDALRVIPCRSLVDQVVRVCAAPVHGELLRRLEIKIGTHLIFSVAIIGQHSVGVVHLRRQQILEIVRGSPRHLYRRSIACGVVVQSGNRPAAVVSQKRIHVQQWDRIRSELTQAAHSGIQANLPLCFTGRATLREDLDHACRRIGAVQCGSGRTLHDFDAVDVIRVDIVEGARVRVGTTLGRAGKNAVAWVLVAARTHPVDEHQRLVGQGHAGGST